MNAVVNDVSSLRRDIWLGWLVVVVVYAAALMLLCSLRTPGTALAGKSAS
jgi:hypothetical protein